MPPLGGAYYFHADLASLAVSAQVRPRAKKSWGEMDRGGRGTCQGRESPVRKEEFFKERMDHNS